MPEAVAAQSGTSDFLAAFNQIENHFRSRLSDDHSGFRQLADKYADKYGLRTQDMRALRMFADLRNFLVHNEYYNGEPVADPVPGIIAAIQGLREKILQPPLVLSVLPHRPISQFSPGDPVSSVLDAVRKHDYSQFPIYNRPSYCGLLTTNCIGRWLADRLLTEELAESEPISTILQFAEPRDTAAHLPRSATVAQAIRKLSLPASGGHPPAALLITENGKIDQKPLAIVVADDLTVLFRALD
ncbi:CBS domain-containing protein [Mycobacterium sp.]|uniref:CBS domain-containing protein n=1 Tax=Mycobacterium sp. TaxID=1785 RepID=UPI003F9C7360